jgi:hypothetical protein
MAVRIGLWFGETCRRRPCWPASRTGRRAKGLAIAGRAVDGVLLAEGARAPFVESEVQKADEAEDRPRPRECVAYPWLRVDDDDRPAEEVLRPAVEHWRRSGLYRAPTRLAPRDARELGVVGDPSTTAAAT